MMTLTRTEQGRIRKETMTGRNIHHLQPELLHMICIYLEPAEIAVIRLLDRNIAVVGLEHIVSQIHLIAQPDSFDRLLAVAEHPVANQYVTSIFYEADLLESPRSLQPQDDRERWENSVVAPNYAGASLKKLPDPYFAAVCDCLPRKYYRRSPDNGSNQQYYTKRELQQAYKIYRSYCTEQRRMHESAVYEEAMVRAMKRLPHLTWIKISCGRGMTNHFRAAFEAGLSENVALDYRVVGAFQLSFLLSAADKAGLQIKHLVCGLLGQRFLDLCALERLDPMKRSIQHLRSLHLFFACIPEETDPDDRPNPNGSRSDGTESMRFVTSASNLEVFSIRFDIARYIDPPDLKHIVLDFHWSSLASATFAKMSTSPETLVGFCNRHASTLKDFSLTDINLHSGRWDSTFYEMRQRLNLNDMALGGLIRSGEGESWDFDHKHSTTKLTKLMFERYIIHSGETQLDISLARFILMFIL